MKQLNILILSSSDLRSECRMLDYEFDHMSKSEIECVPVTWFCLDSPTWSINKDKYLKQLRQSDICIVLLLRSLGKCAKQYLDIALAEQKHGHNPQHIHVLIKGGADKVITEHAAYFSKFREGHVNGVHNVSLRGLHILVEKILQENGNSTEGVLDEQSLENRVQDVEALQSVAEKAMLDSGKKIEERCIVACDAYEKAIDTARKIHYEDNSFASLLFDYARFIMVQPTLNDQEVKLHKAVECFSEALDIYQRLTISKPNNYLHSMAAALNNRASVYMMLTRPFEAEDGYRKALKIHQKLAESNPDVYLPEVASTLYNLAYLLIKFGRPVDEAEELFRESLAIYQSLAESHPNTYNAYILDVAMIYSALARLSEVQGNLDDAEKNYRNSLAIRQCLAETNPNDNLHLPEVQGNLDDAEKNYRNSLVIRQCLAETYPNDNLHFVAKTLYNLARVLIERKCPEEAEEYFRQAIEAYQRIIEPTSDMHEKFSNELAESLRGHAFVLIELDRYDEAVADFKQALNIFQNLVESNFEYMSNVVTVLHNCGDCYRKMGLLNEAEEIYHKAIVIHQQLYDSGIEDELYKKAEALQDLARVQVGLTHYSEAKDNYHQAIGLFQRVAELNPDVYNNKLPNIAATMNNFAILLQRLNHNDEAKDYFQQSLDIFKHLAAYSSDDYLSIIDGIQNNLDILHDGYDCSTTEIEESNEIVDISTLSTMAKQGDAVSQRSLAFSYYTGDSVSKEWTKALYWHEKAAVQGDEMALEFLEGISKYTYYKGVDAFMKQDFDEAIRLFEDALNDTPLYFSVCNYFLGISYEARGDKKPSKTNIDYDRSFRCLKRALQVFVSNLGKDELDTANCQEHLGSVSFKQGKYNDAKNNYNEALRVKVIILGSDHEEVKGLRKIIQEIESKLPLV